MLTTSSITDLIAGFEYLTAEFELNFIPDLG